jgi:hypothetical protein
MKDIVARIAVTVLGALVVAWLGINGVKSMSTENNVRPPVSSPNVSVPPDTVATRISARTDQQRQRTVLPPWTPPPYIRLRVTEPRTHPLEFKLFGDSVVVDGLYEQGTSPEEQWPTDVASTPMLTIAIHTASLLRDPRFIEEHTYAGQWVTFERDRAIFVVPKNGTVGRNLRLRPSVRYGTVIKRPRVVGKWIRKTTPGVWECFLEVRKDGGFKKTRWHNSDFVPAI